MADQAPVVAEPTQDERTMATLAHVLQIVGWWIAPLIVFLIKRESRFVSFHALQALILQVCILALWMVGMAAFFGAMFATMPTTGGGASHAPPPAVMVLFPLFWLLAMGGWVLVLVMAIVYGVKAGRGEWASYPLLGGIARRILKL